MLGWLGRGIVVCAGCSPPGRGTSPRATFPPPHAGTPAAYWGTGPAFDRESICGECQGYSGGWDGGLWCAPDAPHPGGGQAAALH